MNDYTEELDTLDTQRLAIAVLTMFRIYESAYVAYERDLMHESEWDRFQPAICRNYRRVQNWQKGGLDLGSYLTQSFMNHTTETCTDWRERPSLALCNAKSNVQKREIGAFERLE